MSNLIFVADLHIKLGQKNVPRDWQYNRFMLLAEELNSVVSLEDTIIIAGDLLDVAKPSLEEVGLMYDFLNILDVPVILIPGNHEMTTKKKDCYRFIDSMLKDLGVVVIRDFHTQDGIDYIPYNVLHNKEYPITDSSIAITHVRGEIPPHVQPEVDLEKFNGYDKVFAGDLHSYTNSQGNILYPGSPFSTSFHRGVPSGANGYFSISLPDKCHIWTELHLPQLIRKTVSNPEDMIATEFHHTIYELEGSLEDLALVENSDLLDKKVTKDISAPPTLNMSGDMAEELAEFLVNIKDVKEEYLSKYITLFKEVVFDKD